MILAIYIIFFGGIAFGFWLVYDFICWKYAAKIEQAKMSRQADRMYAKQQKSLILYNIEKEKAILEQKRLDRLAFPNCEESKRHRTKLIESPSAEKPNSWAWAVEREGVVDVDFTEISE